MEQKIYPWPTTVQKVAQYIVDLGDTGRWAYLTTDALFFFILIFLAIYMTARAESSGRGTLADRLIRSKAIFCFFILAFILMARIPQVVMGTQNPDEPLWVIDAKTLIHDPRPFVSIDTSTGGPLMPISIALFKIIGLPIDLGTLKIASATTMALAACLLFLAAAATMPQGLARIVTMPFVVMVCIFKDYDMVAYNSEHPVILLLCMSLWLLALVRKHGGGKYNVRLVLLGLTLGSVPFAKLQGAPIAMFVGLVGCYVAFRNGEMKSLVTLVASAVVPAVSFTLALWIYGGLEYYWTTHIVYNLVYANIVPHEGNTFSYKMEIFFRILSMPKEAQYFFQYILITSLLGFSLVVSVPGRIEKGELIEIIFAVALLCISIYCVVVPSRAFGHYGLLSFVPMVVLTAVLINVVCAKIGRWAITSGSSTQISLAAVGAALFLLLISIYYFISNFSYQPYYLFQANERYGGFAPQGYAGMILDRYFVPDTKMAVWDYEPELFEGTDFQLGTRFGIASMWIIPEETRKYFLTKYLDDLKKNQPKLFVYPSTRTKDNFEDYPEMKEYITSHYTLDAVMDGYKIFVRNDKFHEKEPWINRKAKWSGGDNPFFHADLQVMQSNGSFFQFGGWAVLRDDVIHQTTYVALRGTRDTTYVETYKLANKGVSDFSGKKEQLMCGYVGFVPANELPEGDLEVGLMVENLWADQRAIKFFGRKINRDSL